MTYPPESTGIEEGKNEVSVDFHIHIFPRFPLVTSMETFAARTTGPMTLWRMDKVIM